MLLISVCGIIDNQHRVLLMPYRKIFFEKDRPVHIVSRAVEGLKIFEKQEDAFRFIFQLQVANLGKRSTNLKNKDMVMAGQALLRGEKIPASFIVQQHPPLISLLDFSLVVNHYHFYLLPNAENIIPVFMQKLNNSFAKYYNARHGRKDILFGSRYKGISAEDQFQSDAISRYVGIINPLDVFQPKWRENGLGNWSEALKFLEDYEFSSFPDKVGKRQSKILAPKEVLEKYSLGRNEQEYKEFAENFLKEKLNHPAPYFLE